MHWRTKASLYRILSAIPGGEAFYRFAQRHITKSLTATAGRIGVKIDVGLRYLKWLADTGRTAKLDGGTHVDFGAGWHPTIPLALYAAGVERQFLLDLQPVMTSSDVSQAVAHVRQQLPERAAAAGVQLKRSLAEPGGGTASDILERYGISYDAPPRDFPNAYRGVADLVTSTQVLLHIPETDLRRIFRDIYETMRPEGVFLATIHLYPLYGGLMEGPERLEHLRYSPAEWERFGSRIMSYSRLKAPDYRRLLEEAGFSIAAWEVTAGSSEDRATLERISPHPCFAQYTADDLVARHLFFAARRPGL